MIRSLARTMLPATSPKPILEWARYPAGDDPVKDYENWKNNVLTASFGPPKFVKLAVNYDAIYTPRKM